MVLLLQDGKVYISGDGVAFTVPAVLELSQLPGSAEFPMEVAFQANILSPSGKHRQDISNPNLGSKVLNPLVGFYGVDFCWRITDSGGYT